MVVWCKLGLEFLYRQRTNNERVRQRLALVLSSLICFWPLFDRSDTCWSWRLNILVPISLTGRLIYKVSGDLTNAFYKVLVVVKSCLFEELTNYFFNFFFYCRLGYHSQGSRRCRGPMFFTLGSHAIGTIIRTPSMDGLVDIFGFESFHGTAGCRDGCGRIFGRLLVGAHLGTGVRATSLPNATGETKNNGREFGGRLEVPPLRVMLVYGALAAVAEGTAPGHWDNVAIALILQASWDRVPLWLPSDENTSVAVVPIVVSVECIGGKVVVHEQKNAIHSLIRALAGWSSR
eukprot:scaffold2849_cov174-Amphora_coffeaeformis.AAC.9